MELTEEQIRKLDWIAERTRFVAEEKAYLKQQIQDGTISKKEAISRQEMLNKAHAELNYMEAEAVQPDLSHSLRNQRTLEASDLLSQLFPKTSERCDK